MIALGVTFAAILGLLGILTRAKLEPSMCPQCRAVTLMPDQRGMVWVCASCGRRFLRLGGNFLPHDTGPPVLGEERIPSAKIRRRGDD